MFSPPKEKGVSEKIEQLISLKKGHMKRKSMQSKLDSKLNDLAETKRRNSRHQSIGGAKDLANTAGVDRLGISGFLEMKKKEIRAKKIIELREKEKVDADSSPVRPADDIRGAQTVEQEPKKKADELREAEDSAKRPKHGPQKSVDLSGKVEGSLLAEFKKRNNSLIEKIALEKMSVASTNIVPSQESKIKKELRQNSSLKTHLEIVDDNHNGESSTTSGNRLGTPTFFNNSEFSIEVIQRKKLKNSINTDNQSLSRLNPR